MSALRYCSFRSFRLLGLLTLFLVIVRCYVEITVFYYENLRNTERHHSLDDKFENIVDGNAEQKHKIKLTTGSKGEFDDIKKYDSCETGFKSTYSLSKISTDWNTWTYRERVNCPEVLHNSAQLLKSSPSLNIQCTTTKSKNRIQASKDIENGVQKLPFGSACLDTYIQACCSTDRVPVPKVVHYAWYGIEQKFSFYGFLSFISVIRFVRPCVILIHGNTLPSGVYWNFVLNLYPKIIHVTRKIGVKIYGKKPKFRNHFSDVIRIEALIRYGGIYLDMDMVLVKEIDFFRKYVCTMSRMRRELVASSFIMAMKNSTFLQKWLNGYKYYYRNESYIYNAMNYPNQLSYNYTHLIHIELETLSRPWSQRGDKIYYSNFDWSKLYGMHLYNRLFERPVNETVIKQMNTTFGSIARHILYGNKELCVS